MLPKQQYPGHRPHNDPKRRRRGLPGLILDSVEVEVGQSQRHMTEEQEQKKMLHYSKITRPSMT